MSSKLLLRQFAEETDVFGLHLFKCRRSTAEVIFWCLFVSAFACYTTKTLVGVCTKYIGEEVITVVQQQRDDQFKFPSPMLRIRADGVGNGVAQIDDILAQFFATGTVNTSDIFTSMKFLDTLADLEYDLTYGLNSSTFTSSESPTSAISSIVMEAGISSTLEKFPNSNLTSFSDFVLEQFCRALRPKVLFKNTRPTSPTMPAAEIDIADCLRERIDLVDSRTITLALDNTNLFDHYDDKLEITFSTTSKEMDANITNVWLDVDRNAHFQQYGSTDLHSRFEIALNHRSIYSVRLSTIYQNLDLKRRPCDPDRERGSFCLSVCDSQFFVDSFGCVALFFSFVYQFSPLRQNLSELPRCEAGNYINFTNILPSSETIEKHEECERACFAPCRTLVFVVDGDTREAAETTAATVIVSTRVYLFVEEAPARDFETFLADFGGALGLWLGISLASLVHMPVFVLQTIVNVVRKRKPAVEMPATEEDFAIFVDRFEAAAKKRDDHVRAMALRLERLESILYNNDNSSNSNNNNSNDNNGQPNIHV